MARVKIPTLKLNSGYEMPAVGLGTWVGLDGQGNINRQDMPKLSEALKYAIDIGYRHIDTAHLYRSEAVIGDVVQEKIAEGKVKREDLFITTKVWNHMHAFDDVLESLKGSLKRLKTDYIDLALVHWPMSVTVNGEDAKIDYLETWRGMEAAQAAGLARSIGVSNFSVDQLRRLLDNCKVKPAMNQIEVNLNLGQKELVDFCQSQGIAITAYTPFGILLPGRSPPDSPQPKVDTPAMVTLTNKYKKTATQIALRYLYQRGIASIPKSLTNSRIFENGSIFDFELSKEDFDLLSTYDVGYRTVRPFCWQDFQNYPFDKVEGKMAIPEVLKNCD